MANEIPRLSQTHPAASASLGSPGANSQALMHGRVGGQPYYVAAVPRPPAYGGARGFQAQAPHNKSRRLYVGNIPYHVGISEHGLVQLFSALYVTAFRPLSPGEALPVSSFWLHADGKFGFMELRGDAEAVDIMQLNGVVLHGRALRINRPSDYSQEMHGPAVASPSNINVAAVIELCSKLGGIVAPPAHLLASAAASDLHAQMQATSVPASMISVPVSTDSTIAGSNPESFATPPTLPITPAMSGQGNQTSVAPAPEPGSTEGGNRLSPTQPSAEASDTMSLPAFRSQPQPPQDNTVAADVEKKVVVSEPAFVVCLRNLVSKEDLDGSLEEYNDLVEDVRDECSNFGKVSDILIPREGRGRGTAFIAYPVKEDAVNAIEGLRKLVFNGVSIEALIVPDVASVDQAAANCP